MDPNELNIVGKVAYHVFYSNYLRECSFPVIAIIILLILVTVSICTKRHYDSQSTSALSCTKLPSTLHANWPDVHQTSVSMISQTLPGTNSGTIVVNIPTSISSPMRLQNKTDARETDPLLDDVSHHLVNCNKRYQKQQESGGCGLENFGHSCYINSALQCLCHIRPFVEIILNLQEQPPCLLPPITSAYHRLLTEMQSISEGSASAHEIQVRIGEINRRFAGTDEQDSHEFLTVLLEALHDELMDNYQKSSIGDLMHGIIRSTVKCLVCEEETNTEDSFISLSLPIYRPTASGFMNIIKKSTGFFGYGVQNDNTLYDCLENLLASERLGANGQWFCRDCQKLTDAIKKLDLYQLPKVLILQLKRFTYDLTSDTKITTKIHIEEVLDLGKFVIKNDTNQPSMYDLVAVIAHTGTLASGHYTTFARHSSNCCWYHFNDRHVRQASLHEALTADAYVLVYELQHLHSNL